MHTSIARLWRASGSRAVSALRLTAGDARGEATCRVIDEDALTIDVEGVGRYMLMWTPADDDGAVGFVAGEGVLGDEPVPERLTLAAGFAYSEGIIGGLADIATMAVCPDRRNVVRMRLHAPERVAVKRRDVVVASSCGVCGGREAIEDGFDDFAPVAARLRLAASELTALMAAMQRRQRLFRTTGGAHAAAVFSPQGGILAVAEDLGRHNALDKVVGECLLREMPLAGCGVVLSSRLSYEMVAKAARAGFELVAAVSAPTSLAIELAERAGITLCGFVRGASATIYTHPQRIRDGAGGHESARATGAAVVPFTLDD
ncbi:formate dehydrogenase accessory sulfurtransferase FdhD [Aromatoleum petrolei]|uniref:Sulfur carrier protein FdhD n=1 Tax=Aromatoleum petrolei TaxID=76116 RepID=A0ABX1MVJ3_9RHOO|nr:formate dehydrogenase accessory sulfurtransferase FdhD [Aromatoleum petrolei]NMF90104.1 formate dehydrogenase accessory sulfurtransferase FdhD [Aromatoleum petrolei]QTQ34224.1 Sulfur carrier protein domain-containing protein, FdhD-like [Aromatoleum petrolei]